MPCVAGTVRATIACEEGAHWHQLMAQVRTEWEKPNPETLFCGLVWTCLRECQGLPREEQQEDEVNKVGAGARPGPMWLLVQPLLACPREAPWWWVSVHVEVELRKSPPVTVTDQFGAS